MNAQEPGFGIYVHWPFCLSKCPYCDFNSHVAQTVDHTRFRRAFLTELASLAPRAGKQTVSSIFFGGGTPSLMEARTVGAVLDAIASHFPMADNVEITLEANPTSIEAARFAAFRAAGVNRASVGIQSLDDAALRFLGRRHSAGEALAALRIAQEVFSRVSFDLIYARPGQSETSWRAELSEALALGTEHLSLYQLTYEPDTPFGEAHKRNRMPTVPEHGAARLYELTQELCKASGFQAYEVSNYARPGAECRHNLVYWRYGEYLGIGPGAHSRLACHATSAIRSPAAWLVAVEESGVALESDEPLSGDDRATEYLLMSFRLAEGTSLARYEALRGTPLDEARIRDLQGDGLLVAGQGRIRATPEGRMLLNSVIAALQT